MFCSPPAKCWKQLPAAAGNEASENEINIYFVVSKTSGDLAIKAEKSTPIKKERHSAQCCRWSSGGALLQQMETKLMNGDLRALHFRTLNLPADVVTSTNSYSALVKPGSGPEFSSCGLWGLLRVHNNTHHSAAALLASARLWPYSERVFKLFYKAAEALNHTAKWGWHATVNCINAFLEDRKKKRKYSVHTKVHKAADLLCLLNLTGIFVLSQCQVIHFISSVVLTCALPCLNGCINGISIRICGQTLVSHLL